MRVYPNPVTDLLRVEYISAAGGPLAYGIYDISGLLVRSGTWYAKRGTNSDEIALGHLQAGLYILELQDGVDKRRLKITRK
jgi:hypothetical protein